MKVRFEGSDAEIDVDIFPQSCTDEQVVIEALYNYFFTSKQKERTCSFRLLNFVNTLNTVVVEKTFLEVPVKLEQKHQKMKRRRVKRWKSKSPKRRRWRSPERR